MKKRCIVAVHALLVYSIAAVALAGVDDGLNGKIRVILRYDDLSSVSSTSLEAKLFDFLNAMEVPCTFGVIPFTGEIDAMGSATEATGSLAPDKIAILHGAVERGYVEVALHGYSHEPVAIIGSSRSEFATDAYESQLGKISSGKRFLEGALGIPVSTFIPPWNVCDSATIRAIEAAGMRCLSADVWFAFPLPPESGLAFVPATCALTEIKEAIAEVRGNGAPDSTIVALFHPYDFREVDEKGSFTLDEFKELVSWIGMHPDIRLISLKQASEIGSDYGLDRYRRSIDLVRTPAHVPVFLSGRHASLRRAYYSQASMDRLETRKRWEDALASLAIYAPIALASCLIGALSFRVLLRRRRRLVAPALTAGLLASIAIILLSLRDGSLSVANAIACAASLACLAGGAAFCLIWGPRLAKHEGRGDPDSRPC